MSGIDEIGLRQWESAMAALALLDEDGAQPAHALMMGWLSRGRPGGALESALGVVAHSGWAACEAKGHRTSNGTWRADIWWHLTPAGVQALDDRDAAGRLDWSDRESEQQMTEFDHWLLYRSGVRPRKRRRGKA
jgi:hypothetical protein